MNVRTLNKIGQLVSLTLMAVIEPLTYYNSQYDFEIEAELRLV